jgi:hypothetical protein
MSSSISGTLELCHTHPRKCCFCFQQLTECERLRSTMLVKEMNNHLLDQLTSVLTTPGNLIADAPAQRMEMHSARVSDVTSHITTKSETHARLQPNQRRAFRVVRLKLQIGKKIRKRCCLTLTVSSRRQPWRASGHAPTSDPVPLGQGPLAHHRHRGPPPH